jgi:hypothetical protein
VLVVEVVAPELSTVVPGDEAVVMGAAVDGPDGSRVVGDAIVVTTLSPLVALVVAGVTVGAVASSEPHAATNKANTLKTITKIFTSAPPHPRLRLA